MQTLDDKTEAIRSLLPLLVAHLQLLPMAGKVTHYQSTTVDPGPPPPVWLHLDCEGVCPACEWERECQGDAWEVVRRMLERKHRLPAIAAALRRLDRKAPQLAGAVEIVYIRCFGAPELQRWADAGVRWMARNIYDDVAPIWEKPKTRTEQIAELLSQGVRPVVIAKRVGCSDSYVRRLRRVLGERSESTCVRCELTENGTCATVIS